MHPKLHPCTQDGAFWFGITFGLAWSGVLVFLNAGLLALRWGVPQHMRASIRHAKRVGIWDACARRWSCSNSGSV